MHAANHAVVLGLASDLLVHCRHSRGADAYAAMASVTKLVANEERDREGPFPEPRTEIFQLTQLRDLEISDVFTSEAQLTPLSGAPLHEIT